MKTKFLLLGGLLNSATLLVGLLVGFFLGTSYSGRVHAETAQQVQEVSPGITTGTFGAGLILAHEIQSDSLVVNGYDLLKMHQNTLNYLATQFGANTGAIQNIITISKADKLYTLKTPSTPKPQEKKP
jgi:hypothetical protein